MVRRGSTVRVRQRAYRICRDLDSLAASDFGPRSARGNTEGTLTRWGVLLLVVRSESGPPSAQDTCVPRNGAAAGSRVSSPKAGPAPRGGCGRATARRGKAGAACPAVGEMRDSASRCAVTCFHVGGSARTTATPRSRSQAAAETLEFISPTSVAI